MCQRKEEQRRWELHQKEDLPPPQKRYPEWSEEEPPDPEEEAKEDAGLLENLDISDTAAQLNEESPRQHLPQKEAEECRSEDALLHSEAPADVESLRKKVWLPKVSQRPQDDQILYNVHSEWNLHQRLKESQELDALIHERQNEEEGHFQPVQEVLQPNSDDPEKHEELLCDELLSIRDPLQYVG